jgi:hypothetical protein
MYVGLNATNCSIFISDLLSGPLLEAALALDEPLGGEMTDKERERLIATLETEVATQVIRLAGNYIICWASWDVSDA